MMTKYWALAVVVLSYITVGTSPAFSETLSAREGAWVRLGSGLEYKRQSVVKPPGDQEKGFEVTLLRIETDKIEIEVVVVLDEVENIFYQAPLFRETPVYNLEEIVKYKKPLAIINGGYTGTYSYPVPAGLLKRRNTQVTHLNAESKVQDGIFCLLAGRPSILARAEYSNGRCSDAIQAGPLLVKDGGHIASIRDRPILQGRRRRSVVGLDSEGRMVLAATTEVDLYTLASYLAEDEKKGGVGWRTALNLSGGHQSILYFIGPSGEKVSNGNLNNPVTSAIAIYGKGDLWPE